MRITIAPFVLLSFAAPSPALAGDAYFIFVDADGPARPDSPCYSLRWMSDVLFFNTSPEPALVRLVAVSNGGSPEVGRSITLAPSTPVSLFTHEAGRGWRPFNSRIGILHLDLPQGVTVSPRLYLTSTDWCVSDALENATYGASSLPHYRSLVPADEPQVHLMADLGSLAARINVAVFNAASVEANAHVGQFEACTGKLIASRDVAIPPDTLVQIEGLKARDSYDCSHGGLNPTPNTNTPAWANYIVVTVTQPSLSYVSSIADDRFPMGILGVGAP